MKQAFLKLCFGPAGVTAEGDSSFYHGNAIEQSDGTRNGVYSEWSWDGATLRVGTCRYGMSPLFYSCGETEFYISNSIPKLLELGVPSDWDDDAMAVFIRRQTFLGEDTPFKHIRATPPGAKLTWTNGTMTLEGRHFTPKPQNLKRSAMIDGVIDLFAQSITRRLPQTDDFYLPLTGGKDSRHILLELARQSALDLIRDNSRHLTKKTILNRKRILTPLFKSLIAGIKTDLDWLYPSLLVRLSQMKRHSHTLADL